MLAGRGFRWRLSLAVVALVALTSAVLGVGAYLLTSRSLQDRLVAESVTQATFDISVLAVELLPDRATSDDVARSGLADAIRQRGNAETLVDFGDGDPFGSSLALAGALDSLSPPLRAAVANGSLAYEPVRAAGVPYLVVGGRRPNGGPDLYLFFPAAGVEEALAGLAQALAVGAAVLVVVALLAAGVVARGVLRPVRAASEAAQRVGEGDLAARVPVASRDEFGQWAAAFNEMAASLERTVADLRDTQARQRRFVSDVSHELRTPLTALVNEAELLRPRLGAMDPDGQRVGDLLIADVARLRSLVDDLMELSRFDAGVERLDLRTVDLGQFLARVVEQRLPGAALSVPPDGAGLVTDPRRLERIVGNLLDNARAHAGAQGVEVAVERTLGGWLVRVSDRGPGVPPATIDRLFDRFEKADPSRNSGGSGLGLAIAREHAVVLGGSLTARLRPTGGLAFDLHLPDEPAAAEDSDHGGGGTVA
ncbi:MAG: two-component system, OmpR family, sensor histidine kinase MtrB [Chloroflexota bacterium]|jgi:two-component system sensor histidine kinase MtrB|nr:two-component system, OmpR family, sensor histidine kinase MtrB [Chloroflexota bacterium]